MYKASGTLYSELMTETQEQQHLNGKLTAAMEAVEAVKDEISKAATINGASTLHDMVQRLARVEVFAGFEMLVESRMQYAVSQGAPADEDSLKALRAKAVEVITRQVITAGPDDTWSGRGNDLRRVVFAAKLEWIDNERWSQ